jgi:hypothetical protein
MVGMMVCIFDDKSGSEGPDHWKAFYSSSGRPLEKGQSVSCDLILCLYLVKMPSLEAYLLSTEIFIRETFCEIAFLSSKRNIYARKLVVRLLCHVKM